MALNYTIEKHTLRFKTPAKTSRNEFKEKLHWLVKVWEKDTPGIIGIGEAAPLEFLSPDYSTDLKGDIEQCLERFIEGERLEEMDIDHLPSVKFALESAFLDVSHGGKQIYFNSDYLTGRPLSINGLVWMNDLDQMMAEALEKAKAGYTCIKFKIGSHDFDAECRLIELFRSIDHGKNIEIRLDANGAFLADEALEKLKDLERFSIHSIEQPVKPGQWEIMAKLCRDSKIDIALDEELIEANTVDKRIVLLKQIKPQFLILKPTLLGGFKACDEWIALAGRQDIGWWATSALESNYGLNAIAQWVSQYHPTMPQGLGTGMLYENNFPSASEIKAGKLYYKPN